MASDLRSELSSEPSEAAIDPDAGSPQGSVEAIEAAETSEQSTPGADLNLVSESDSDFDSNSNSDSDVEADVELVSEEGPGRRGIPIWLALVGLVVAALTVGYQLRIVGQLEAEVTGLEAKLGRTEAVLEAHKTHLGDIRGGVRDLSARLQSLQTLVETEPVMARDQSAPEQP